jgi:transcriptional regulator with XRE-family HTH domain
MAVPLVSDADRALFAGERRPKGRPPFPPLAAYDGFRALLRSHREACGWSQQALARAANMDHGQVSRFEAGTRRPTAESVARLAAALGLAGTAKDRFYVAAGALPDDVPVADLLVLLEVARAGEAGLATLALQLARAAREVAGRD